MFCKKFLTIKPRHSNGLDQYTKQYRRPCCILVQQGQHIDTTLQRQRDKKRQTWKKYNRKVENVFRFTNTISSISLQNAEEFSGKNVVPVYLTASTTCVQQWAVDLHPECRISVLYQELSQGRPHSLFLLSILKPCESLTDIFFCLQSPYISKCCTSYGGTDAVSVSGDYREIVINFINGVFILAYGKKSSVILLSWFFMIRTQIFITSF